MELVASKRVATRERLRLPVDDVKQRVLLRDRVEHRIQSRRALSDVGTWRIDVRPEYLDVWIDGSHFANQRSNVAFERRHRLPKIIRTKTNNSFRNSYCRFFG